MNIQTFLDKNKPAMTIEQDVQAPAPYVRRQSSVWKDNMQVRKEVGYSTYKTMSKQEQ